MPGEGPCKLPLYSASDAIPLPCVPESVFEFLAPLARLDVRALVDRVAIAPRRVSRWGTVAAWFASALMSAGEIKRERDGASACLSPSHNHAVRQ